MTVLTSLWLAACATVRFDQDAAQPDYASQHPTYAEYCTLSQIKKKPGFGADIRGEIGGHAVFYLNGACVVQGAHYPVLELCEGGGVGLSMNAHFRNAKWVATPGREFFFHGNLPAAAPLTHVAYRAVQREAKRLRIYDGVEFHDDVFHDMEPGWSREDWKYEVSAATDYAIGMGRGRYCARVPVDRAAMARMVDFLNAENAPYRAGAPFHWNIITDNCIHLAHNALAAAGIWDELPIHRPLLLAMFDFPVPRNEFVNVVRRTNDALHADPGAVYRDLAARRALLEHGALPSRPGALAEVRPPQQANAVYETELKMIFYDEPIFGPYQGWFDQVFSQRRYTDAAANRAFFQERSRQILARRRPESWWLAQAPYAQDPDGFRLVYSRFYALMERLAQPG